MSRRHDTSGPFDPVRQRPPRRAIDSYAVMRPDEHLVLVTAAQRRILFAPGVLVGSWGVHVLRSRAPLSAHRPFDTLSYSHRTSTSSTPDSSIPPLALRTDDWWSHGGRRAGCICMCSIYFDFRATSFSLYEWLSAAMQGTLSASATASARLLFVPSRAQLESLPKDEKSTPEDERNRAEWQREVHRIRRTLGSVLFLRAGKGVRASISLRNSSCRILMQFCRIAVRVIVIGAKDSSHASQERTVVAARRRSMGQGERTQ
jgi:hypothetical protein